MSLTIRQYALLFSLLTLVLLTAFILKTSKEFEATRNNIFESQKVSAAKELQHAINQTASLLEENTRKLAEWEEIHQQIDNPEYFAYWYTSRLRHTASENIRYLQDLMLYDPQGKALARLSDSSLPYEIEKEGLQQGSYKFSIDGDLVFTIPVLGYNDANNVLGFLSIRTQFFRLMKEQSQFYYIKPESLQLNFSPAQSNDRHIDPQYISYDIVSTPEIVQLEQQLRSSIINLALVIGLPGLILYSLLVFIVSVPINGIRKYLDELRHDRSLHSNNEVYNSFFEVKELQAVCQSLHAYHEELFDTHAILDEKNKALWDQAHHDALTGTFNRRAFDDQWRNLNDLLAEHRVRVCFMLFDVNQFKSINDTYGHQIGDQVLIGISECINLSLRKGEHLFRLGGDEFATFLIDCDTDKALTIANRCLKAIEQYSFESVGMPEPVRISIGISHASDDSPESFQNLQWQADAAMYTAKRPGTSNIVVFNDDMSEDSKGILSSWLSNTVYQAIDKGIGLVLHYQPIIDFSNNGICYYEALVRIETENEVITPGSIFNVVEARHFEVEMDRAVISQLTRDLKAGKIPPGTGASLNLSGPTLIKPQVLEWLQPLCAFVKDYKLVIEVTETALITELQRATDHLKKMQKLGFTIALDDFGSGYSSVKYLASMPVDVVKFDISLVQCLLDDKQRLMVTRLAQMISEAGHQLIAEGIEDKTLLNLVLATGFDFGQGFLFGHAQETPLEDPGVNRTFIESLPQQARLSFR
ncbi:MAG: EAL domain-containing protein [Chromatiales bacterium]|jgi:diguanylate cyclase (GGDEF)-like protein